MYYMYIMLSGNTQRCEKSGSCETHLHQEWAPSLATVHLYVKNDVDITMVGFMSSSLYMATASAL